MLHAEPADRCAKRPRKRAGLAAGENQKPVVERPARHPVPYPEFKDEGPASLLETRCRMSCCTAMNVSGLFGVAERAKLDTGPIAVEERLKNIFRADIGVPQPRAIFPVLVDQAAQVVERLKVFSFLLSRLRLVLHENALLREPSGLLLVHAFASPAAVVVATGRSSGAFDRMAQ